MPVRHYLTSVAPQPVTTAVDVFSAGASRLRDPDVTTVADVLDIVRPHLVPHGWTVADGSRAKHGVARRTGDGAIVRLDGWHDSGTALWIETGRSWNNFGFLQHVAEAAVLPNGDHVVVAINESYGAQATFVRCQEFLAMLLGTERMTWPFRSVTLIGV